MGKAGRAIPPVLFGTVLLDWSVVLPGSGLLYDTGWLG
jgi:hypothetical protein